MISPHTLTDFRGDFRDFAISLTLVLTPRPCHTRKSLLLCLLHLGVDDVVKSGSMTHGERRKEKDASALCFPACSVAAAQKVKDCDATRNTNASKEIGKRSSER